MGLFMKASIKWFKEGKGIERYADGNVYEGEFKIIKQKEKEFIKIQMES